MKPYAFALAAITVTFVGCDSAKKQASLTHEPAVPVTQVSIAVQEPTPQPVVVIPKSAEELAAAYMIAANAKDTIALHNLVCWDRVENRKSQERSLRRHLKNHVNSVAVTPLPDSFKVVMNRGVQIKGEKFVPNLTVNYVLTPKTKFGDGQISIGQKDGRWFLTADVPE